MKKLHCIICGKYRKFTNSKVSYLFTNTVLSVICSKGKNEYEKIFKEEESIGMLKIHGLIKNI